MAAPLLARPAAAQEEMDADRAVAGGGALPAGFEGRTDRGQGFENVRFEIKDGLYHISVGPAVVLYRPEHTASGTYRLTSTVTQTSSKGHAHGAGLIFGGADLQGPDQVYTYFLVRGDGTFIVKTRTGATTALVSERWQPHPALHTEDANGHATNELEVEVGEEDVIFRANGQEVFRAPRSELYTDGVYGIRLNHNLDMIISPPELHTGM
ncbi:MAG: hypothetical protein D6701_10145 [Gemmatimonadetes bacterium]|nr:MAG: hypothetical protein D6701_10145 [Gemmatimonadota bacterium]